MSDGRVELHKALREAHEKYTYFLLAASGAAMAFATTQAQAATVTLSKLPLALAVVSWALSFFFGCRQIGRSNNFLWQNFQYLRMKAGDHPNFPPDPRLVAAISEDLEAESRRVGRYGAWQLNFLFVGAIFYIVWHVTEMYLRIAMIGVFH
jgi:hypothetical protein